MSASEKPAEAKTVEPKKRGRPPKQEPTTPQSVYYAEQAEIYREKKKSHKVIDKFYELNGHKLSFCKRVSTGTVYKTFVGSTTDKKYGEQVTNQIKKLQAEGKLRIKL